MAILVKQIAISSGPERGLYCIYMKILAIETSCDETAAAVAEDFGSGVKILSNVVSSQIELHKKYGGVVPEVAAREHVLEIIPAVDQALKEAGISRQEIIEKRSGLDALAVAAGPGLFSSLQTGVETIKNLAYAWELPIVAINHIEGHIYANFIDNKEDVVFPVVVLTVSGGHTMLVLMKGHGVYEKIGETRDDAAGEAFDKAAKLMNIGYPGGPIVSRYAQQFKDSKKVSSIKFPRPMIDADNFDFSFSGLKTAIRYAIESDAASSKKIDEYCYQFQEAVVEVLVSKTIKAAKKHGAKTVMLAGGVSANDRLRESLEISVKNDLDKVDFRMPALKYTTDNAAMVASAGVYKALRHDYVEWKNLTADPNLGFI
jgi:N6-L-threonylcarbamoyladenine synthase